jgi:hypothetical protein
MIIFLIILSYITTIFLGRYFDIKVSQHINNIHYKTYLHYGLWFIPVLNIWMPFVIYLDHEIDTRKKDVKHNKFINWFFVGYNYKSKHDKQYEKEFNEWWNKKDTNKDLSNPFVTPVDNKDKSYGSI